MSRTVWDDEGNAPLDGIPIARLIAENRFVSCEQIDKLNIELAELKKLKREKENAVTAGAMQTALNLLANIATSFSPPVPQQSTDTITETELEAEVELFVDNVIIACLEMV